MENPTTTTNQSATTTKKPAAKKTTGKGGMNKTWLIVGVLIVLALGSVNFYYMKKNKELQKKLDAAKSNSSGGLSEDIATKEASPTAPQDREVAGDESSETPE